MTWKDLIHQVGREVRSPDFWPSTGDANQEQLDRVHTALVALAARMPLHTLGNDLGVETRAVALTTDDLSKGDLPSDLFSRRTDKGILSLEIEGKLFTMLDAAPFSSVIATAGNSYHAGNIRFTVDPSGRKLYSSGLQATTDTMSITIIPEPSKPLLTDVNAGTTQWKVNSQDTEVIIQTVATHVTSVRNRDSQIAQIHQILTKYYSGEINA